MKNRSVPSDTITRRCLMNISREDLLNMTDQNLLDRCRCESFRASGPGGQHRNTTDSAVRLTLKGTTINAYSASSRSQHKNKAEALKKLRFEIAFTLRSETESIWSDSWKIGKNDRRYPLFIAQILDALTLSDYRVSDAARALQISTGKLIRILSTNPQLWKRVNENRIQRQLKPLKR